MILFSGGTDFRNRCSFTIDSISITSINELKKNFRKDKRKIDYFDRRKYRI